MSANTAQSGISPDSSTLRRESPTLYRALSDRLKKDGLSWSALESIALESQEYFRLLTPEEARKVLARVKFTQGYSLESRDNPDFFAFTNHRVYYQFDGELGRVITSIPRNPLDVAYFTQKNLQIRSTAKISEGLSLGGATAGGILPE